MCACHIRHWLAACCEKGSQVRKPSSPIIASHTVRPMWPRYGNFLEVVDGNWMLRGSRQNHKVSEETRPLDARHTWPTSVRICPGVCKPCSQLWIKVELSTVLWMERETPLSNLRILAAYPLMGKPSGENPEDKSSLGPVKSLLCFQERFYTRS